VVFIAVLQFTKIFETATGKFVVGGLAIASVVCIGLSEFFTFRSERAREGRERVRDQRAEEIFTTVVNRRTDGHALAAAASAGSITGETAPVGIGGSADLLVVRLELSDLHIEMDGGISVDFGVFVCISVSALDKPRTIKRFLIEIRTIQSGVVTNPPTYTADSERELGDYLYRYKQETTNSYGYMVQEEFREPMDDLPKIVRSPLLPGTHAEGWVRFELKRVVHQLNKCSISIYAIDAADQKHEIQTENMTVKGVEDHAYAILKGR
jgi:hypothetical protein